ncbi:flagellar attachment zone protein 1-like [Mastacembelus armatus]|uniref:flagellar attachment zone protein 1-like n=1 Tax=Mastacembelus armatus TaxID=205130 RepID=UPI000E463239|nr:flagellar attachment zone protein 1-like [Mastacembelus armatus]
MTDALKVSHEAVCCQNTALQRELERLNSEYQNAKQFSDSYNENMSRVEDLKKENDHLREQIQVVSEQLQSTEFLKDKYKELEAEEKSAMAQNTVLAKTYSEKLKKLTKEEAWTHKYDKLKEQIDALKQGNGKIVEDIQGCNANLEDLNNLKVQHKLLKTEKKKLVNQQFSKQRAQMEKNEVLIQETKNLTTDNCALWDKIETISKSLHDENILGITFNSLMVEKNAMKQQNEALHKEVQRLTKKRDKEKGLEERCVAVKTEKEEISRQIHALETDIQNSFRR